MSLSRVEIINFRNLKEVRVYPSENCNIFYGDNGSGKTSLLEALYHLSFGRSFRTRFPTRIIHHQSELFSIFGEVDHIPVGIEKGRDGHTHMRMDQQEVHSVTELLKLLPLLLIDHSVYQLIDSGPLERRQFLDWGVFHVEHDPFLLIWQKFRRLLTQRNANLKLRNSTQQQTFWDEELVDVAMQLNELRREYWDRFEQIFSKVLPQFLPSLDIKMVFYSGWDDSKDLKQTLMDALEKDVLYGYTRFGPHRADLRIYVNNLLAVDVLSRGQQKLLAFAMKLSQVLLLKETTGKRCVLLLDDLGAELDDNRIQSFCEFLRSLDSQIFMTGTHLNGFNDFFSADQMKMFHVEQGEIFPL
jgi:DNA replication and repair protein RecF